jgi:hypothetical protein
MSGEPVVEVPPAEKLQPPPRETPAKPLKPETGLSPYATAALDSACRKIVSAPQGEQETTLNSEVFSIGTLAAAGAMPPDFARRALIWAAQQIPSHDARRPWLTRELETKVELAFADGLRCPREVRP